MRVSARTVELSTDGERRVHARVLHRVDRHRRRGGLAMRAGEQDLAVARHDLRKQIRATNHRNSCRTGSSQFWVILRNRRK